MRSLAITMALAASWVMLTAPMALADPPGPTDYQSEVSKIEPPTPGLDIEIVGGDSFVLLRVPEGISVEVIGYQGEQYLRYLPDGTVEENVASPSKYLNEERFGGDLPEQVDANAAPQWEVVADDGSYAWHDHRTHWMNSVPPPGLGPGDQVAEGVIPLLWDGVEVKVTAISTWQEAPRLGPMVVGLLLGHGIAIGVFRRRKRWLLGVSLALAIGATFVGVIAYLSMPSETAPSWTLWVLPASALLLALVSIGLRGETAHRYRTMFLLIAALELAVWGLAHWGWLRPAILPTALPYWIDRLISSAVLVGAPGAAAAAVALVVSETRDPSPA
jgi:hypothetical protein